MGDSVSRSVRLILQLTNTKYRPGYIAGVTNPIFEATGSWDLLIDVTGGRVVVSKDIHSSCPTIPIPSLLGIPLARTPTNKGDGMSAPNEDDNVRSTTTTKSEFKEKADSSDNIFMDEVRIKHAEVSEEVPHIFGRLSPLFRIISLKVSFEIDFRNM